jgi:DNA-directed RNA polymerase subunit K/omega
MSDYESNESDMSDAESDFSEGEIDKPVLPQNIISNKAKPVSTINIDADSDEEDVIEDDEEELEVDGFKVADSDEENPLEEEEEHFNKNIVIPPTNPLLHLEEDDDDDEDTETYLQKFNTEVNSNYIVDFHPECLSNNYSEIAVLAKVIRDGEGNVIDDLHRTIPFLTKYEKARILGQRAKQINTGAKAFVKVPENNIDGYLIAELELAQKRLPFIIRRPIAGGNQEYWFLKDLEDIAF